MKMLHYDDDDAAAAAAAAAAPRGTNSCYLAGGSPPYQKCKNHTYCYILLKQNTILPPGVQTVVIWPMAPPPPQQCKNYTDCYILLKIYAILPPGVQAVVIWPMAPPLSNSARIIHIATFC